jgi:hypothetical protein
MQTNKVPDTREFEQGHERLLRGVSSTGRRNT